MTDWQPARLADARRVGAAPRDLDRLAASRAGLAGQARRRFRGSTREIARVLAEHEPVEILCHNEAVATTRGAIARSARRARGPRPAAPRARPIACGSATRRRPASSTRRARVVLLNWAFNALGEVRQLARSTANCAMLDELRRLVPATVTTVQAAFEDLPLAADFDLVFAAASLHWTEPEQRWSRVAAMLQPGGTFASFGGQAHLADPEVEEAVRAVRSTYLEDDGVPSPDGTPDDSDLQWPGTELERSSLFTDVRQSTLERHLVLPARDYVGHLSTISAYLQLPDAVRERVLREIREVLPARIDVTADITLHLARLV